MCFKKNPNYWDAEHPFADEIDFLVVPDDNTRIMQLQAGQVDIATGINAQIAILVAIGVNSDGNREVIGATEGGREDKESFRNVESTRSVSCFTKSSIAFTSRSEINTSQ